MNLTRGTGDADLEAARVRSWLAALASVVLLTPVALLVLLIAKDGEARRGWLEVLVVIMALPYLSPLWRLTWRLDAVGGGRAVGAGWFGVALVCALLVPLPLLGPLALWIWAPLFSPRFLAAVPVIPHLISLIVYLGAVIALQSVLIRQGSLLRRRAAGHDRRRGGFAVAASFGYAALWGVSWWVTTAVGEHQERQRFLALERRSADERAASHPAPPSLELVWMIDLRRQVHRPFKPAAAPAVAPDGTIYLALDTGLLAIAPGGEVSWRNPAVRAQDGSPVIGPDGTVYVRGTDATLYAVRPDGTLKWAVAPAAPGAALVGLPRPAVGKDGTIYGVRPDSTQTRLELLAVSPNGSVRWRTPIGRVLGEIIPAADGGVYVVGSGALHKAADTLLAVRGTGVVRWRLPLPPKITDDGVGLAIGGDGRPFLGRDSGVVPVRAPDASVARAAPRSRWQAAALLGEDGAVLTWRGTMILARGPDGVERWRHDVARLLEGEDVRSITHARGSGRLYVSTKYRVVVLDPEDGRELADYAPTIEQGSRPPRPSLHAPTPPVVAPDGTIYVVDDSYRLHALRMR